MDEMDGLLGLSLRLLRGLIAERHDRGQSLAIAAPAARGRGQSEDVAGHSLFVESPVHQGERVAAQGEADVGLGLVGQTVELPVAPVAEHHAARIEYGPIVALKHRLGQTRHEGVAPRTVEFEPRVGRKEDEGIGQIDAAVLGLHIVGRIILHAIEVGHALSRVIETGGAPHLVGVGRALGRLVADGLRTWKTRLRRRAQREEGGSDQW